MIQPETLQITVNGKNIEVTPALREHAMRKVSKLERFFPNAQGPIVASVSLSIERELDIAEVTLQVQGFLVRAESRTDDMYASIEQCVDRLERQIRKHKSKLQRQLQKAVGLGEAHARQVRRTHADRESDVESESRVVRTKRFQVKPMDVDEAVLQMELLDHDFFVFANADTGQVNVLYKRSDDNYGLIEPAIA